MTGRLADWILVLPIVVPMATSIVLMLARRRGAWRDVANVSGAAALLVCAVALLAVTLSRGILVTQAGGWPAPYGITLVADAFSALLLTSTSLVAFAASIYSVADLDEGRKEFGYYPLFHFLLMGTSGALLAGDLFNLYVWFEILLMGSFVLMALGGEKPQLEGAVKYVTLSLLSSMLFLLTVGLLYGVSGTLNMAHLAQKLPQSPRPGLVAVLGVMLVCAYGIKAALFPLYFWLPASYHTPPAAVSALFAGLLTKVGVYALVRVTTLVFAHEHALLGQILLVAGSLTMLSGVLGAVAQMEFRRILSVHIISQIGYMVLGLAIMTPLALAGAVFYIVHNILVKTNLFFVAGYVRRLYATERLKKLGGVSRSHPWTALLFMVSALSLAGLPPLSGFWAKLFIIQAGFLTRHWLATGAALLTSLLTLFSMIKIWNEVFWKAAPAEAEAAPIAPMTRVLYLVPIVFLTLCVLAISLGAEPLFSACQKAAAQLADPTAYIQAVLGTKEPR